jgi:hypothetical protein
MLADFGAVARLKDVVAMITPISAMDKNSKRLVDISVSSIGLSWV